METIQWAAILLLSLGFAAALIMKTRIRVLPGMTIAGVSGLAAGLCAIQLTHSLFAFIILDCVLIVAFSLIIIALMFFRDPRRIPPDDPGILVSPADGQVIYIKSIENGEVPVSEKKGRTFLLKEMLQTDILNDGCLLIGIEMNILNVHVNRAPAAGTIIFRKHISGKFLSLRNPESAFENERVTSVLDIGECKIGIVQIASRLVRRIVSYKKQGDRVGRGERIGMIKFGSQVDVVLPSLPGLKAEVKTGDSVRAGETVIAKFIAGA